MHTGALTVFAMLLAGWSFVKAVNIVRKYTDDPNDSIETLFGRMTPEDIAGLQQHGSMAMLTFMFATVIASGAVR